MNLPFVLNPGPPLKDWELIIEIGVREIVREAHWWEQYDLLPPGHILYPLPGEREVSPHG
jgi:hypothetical protein